MVPLRSLVDGLKMNIRCCQKEGITLRHCYLMSIPLIHVVYSMCTCGIKVCHLATPFLPTPPPPIHMPRYECVDDSDTGFLFTQHINLCL